MVKPEELVAAGAYLSMSDKLKNEATVDTISARNYRHPALGERSVVRLTADNLAEGEDLTMEFLGCSAPTINGPIARRQRQALGFPGWALVNDPKHARYALELVKEFKKAVRRSKAKPGFGYDEFTEISKRLGKSVAHFLPSFWEQAGREFIALDNTTYGSRAFSKAREAEKVHALKVNESMRQDSFLEFALAGAVSIKALTEYGKELLSTHDPKSAWKFFRELCVRRTLGGMPPWTSMIKDVHPLTKAAGLDQEQEVHAILIEIIDSPSISRAAMGFWDSASKYIGSLVKNNTHVAGVLLNLIPQTSSWQHEDIWPWLNHLDSWGILDNAWKDGVPEDAGPTGGPAAWLNRLVRSFDRPRQKLFDILEAMAPRLRKEGAPCDLYTRNRWNHSVSADVDLMDLALELKIPMVDLPGEVLFSLVNWAVPVDPQKELRNRPRDPVHLVRDTRFTNSLRKAVEGSAGDAAFEAVAEGKVALSEARKQWLSSLVTGLNSGGLPLAERALNLLDSKTRRPIFAEFPDVLEQLKQVTIVPALTKSIQGGLMDEYGWPTLEQVFESFVKTNKTSPLVFGQFPHLILTDRQKAVVIRGTEIVHEAELKLVKGQELKTLLFLDGDLLVWAGTNYRISCFWNSDPQPSDPEYVYGPPEFSGVTIDSPTGGTFVGEKIIHRGDKGVSNLRANSLIVCDGSHWWLRNVDYDPATNTRIHQLQEIDPITGKRGRKSLPSFFEDFVQDGTHLDVENCSLIPVGPGFANSPLGVSNGLAGTRIRHNSDSTRRIEGIDGRSFQGTGTHHWTAVLKQPGTEKLLPVEPMQNYSSAIGFTLWDPTGSYDVATVASGGDGYSRGQVTGISSLYLHAFEVRDVHASQRLRQVTDSDVQKLVDAEQQDFTDFTEGRLSTPVVSDTGSATSTTPTSTSKLRNEVLHSPKLDAEIKLLLGQPIPDRLLTGLRGLVIRAGQKIRQLVTLVENRSPESDQKKPAIDIMSADVAALPFLTSQSYSFRLLPHVSFMESAGTVADFFLGKVPFPRFPRQWLTPLRILSEGVAKTLWKSYCVDPTDQKWIPFAESWSQHPFFGLPGWFRIFVGENRKEDFLATEKAAFQEFLDQQSLSSDKINWALPIQGKSSRFLVEFNYRGYDVMEYSPDGKFESIPDLTEVPKSEVIIPPSGWSPVELLEFAQLAKSNAINYPPIDMFKSIASDVKASVAEVALVWFGLPKFDDYSANFMPPHLREACKLKAKDCSVAKDALKAMPANLRESLVRAVVSGKPADFWAVPPIQVASRIQSAWKTEEPDRLPLAPEWMDKLTDTFGYGIDKHQFLQALKVASSHPFFSDQGNWNFSPVNGTAELKCDADNAKFGSEILRVATTSMLLLAYGLPVGDPARQKMCDVYQAVKKAIANEGLLLSAGYRYSYGDKAGAKFTETMETIVGKAKQQETMHVADDGLVTAACDTHRLHAAFRPAKLTSSSQITRAKNQIQSLIAEVKSDYSQMTNSLTHFEYFISESLRSLIDRIKNTPVAAGAYETNPILSAPDVVAKIAQQHQLSTEAAAYYLQLLALPDPTDKNVQLWNGWNSATLKKLISELLGKNLVLEASRTRAGRKVFLPGGWEDLKAPHLPLETWKIPLFQLTRDVNQRPQPPLSRIVPLEPVHDLFAKAWQRIVDGDLPRYEEVK